MRTSRPFLILFIVFIVGAGVATFLWKRADAARLPDADQASLVAFYQAGRYESWTHDASIRPTGPFVKGMDYSTHGDVRVYYSPVVS